jgi:hypothetical protein
MLRIRRSRSTGFSGHVRPEYAFLEGLGHHVEWALPELDFRAAFDAQTTCCISNFAQTIINLLAPLGLDRPPADRIEPINVLIWEAGRHISCAERAHAGGLQHHLACVRRAVERRAHAAHPRHDGGSFARARFAGVTAASAAAASPPAGFTRLP